MMPPQFFFYRDEGVLRQIKLDEILFLQANNNYVHFVALNYSHMIRITLDSALAQLPADRFLRTHRSLAVAMDHVDTLGKETLTLLSVPNVELPVSKQYYKKVLEKIRILEPASNSGK